MLALSPVPPGDAHPLWVALVEELRAKLGKARIDALTRALRFLRVGERSLRLAADAAELRRWARDGNLGLLDATLAELTDGACELSVAPLRDPPPPLPLDPAHTLERFVASPSGRGALTEVFALVRGDAASPRPLLVHGPQGSGKTHLLHGIAQALATEATPDTICCRSAVDFADEWMHARWTRGLAAFRARYAVCRALLLDELERLAHRPRIQADLAPLLASIPERGGAIILAAGADPETVMSRCPSLRDALRGARVLPLSPPDWEARVAIVIDRVSRWGLAVEPPVASFLVGRIGGVLERLDPLLTRLVSHPACVAGLLDVEIVREALGPSGSRARPLPAETVLALVARRFNLRVRDLSQATRSARIRQPRQIAMYLLRHHCGLSYPEIGRRFSRHHTTVIHACRQVQTNLERRHGLGATVQLLEKEIQQLREEGG